MTVPADFPNWELLPHDPEGFFGLEAGFDRTVLKRAYNRYLKQFKPEKFPEEFQRIRAAYEALDQELRYGARETRGPTVQPYRWNPAAETSPPPTSPDERPTQPADRPAPRPAPPPLHLRLEQESPETLFDELKRKPSKSPYDYFCLALIGDALPDADDLRLLKWVLAGLKEHPRDPALFHLLYESLRTSLPLEVISKVLVAVSQVIQGDRFYFLTEPVWDRLLKSAPFKTFRETLKACEDRQPVHEVFGRNTFYLHLLRKALWRADDDWLTASFALLDDAAGELPHRLEWDLEVLMVLRSYREQRNQFLDGSSLREAIDRVIRIYCEEDEAAVERAFLTFQLRAASDADEVLEALPFDDEDNHPCAVVWQTWCWIEAEVSGRLGLSRTEEISQPKRKRSMRKWLEAMEARGNSSLGGQVWDVLSLGVGFSQIAASAVVFFLAFSLIYLIWPTAPAFVVLLEIAVSGLAAWFGGRLIFNRVVAPWWRTYCRRKGRNIYAGIWRPEFVSYLQQTRLRFGDARDLMADRYDERLQLCSWLLRYSQGDFGLAFYATALQYAA